MVAEARSGKNQQTGSVKSNIDQQQLNLKIGDMLQLQLLEHPERGRFQVSVIGLYEGLSLIISAPQTNGNLMLLREGQQFIARSLSGKKILGFTAEVMKAYMNPYPYVHLRIPGVLEHHDVRNAYRVEVQLIASIRALTEDEQGIDIDNSASQTITAYVVDISTSGCLIKVDNKLDALATRLSVSIRVNVAEHSRTIQLPAEICSHRKISVDEQTESYFLYGVKFDQLEDDKRLMLYCYVYEKIAHELYSN